MKTFVVFVVLSLISGVSSAPRGAGATIWQKEEKERAPRALRQCSERKLERITKRAERQFTRFLSDLEDCDVDVEETRGVLKVFLENVIRDSTSPAASPGGN